MSGTIKIKKGKNILLQGSAALEKMETSGTRMYAVKPTGYPGLTPKLALREGDEVLAGQAVLYSKDQPEVKFAAPVSGEIAEIVRGDKRKILEIRILADQEVRYQKVNAADPGKASRAEVVTTLMESGCWPFILQRPYNTIPDPDDMPKAIFVSGFDSAPLASDTSFVLNGEENNLKTGFNVLRKLTEGKVHLGLSPKANNTVFDNIEGVEKTFFDGPHPAGLVGVQMHHLDPLNKGEFAWTVNILDVAIIGRVFNSGEFNTEHLIAVAGSEVNSPAYAMVRAGENVQHLLEGNLKEGDNRVIDGNVLTGTQITADGYLGYSSSQISVIQEGKEHEFMGWLFPSYARPSLSKTFLAYLRPNKEYTVNTNIHGEERAFVMSGEYEKVLPMDIMPVQLLKAILAQDLDAMEQLGIYEVVEEDLALCEFACTSKIDVQEILRNGLDLMRKEG